MRSFAMSLTTVCLTTLMATSAGAAGRPESPEDTARPARLYTLDKTARAPVAGRLEAPDAVEEFTIEVDPETVALNPPALTIDLPRLSIPLEAVRTRFVVYGPDWKSWIGTLRHAGTEGEGTGYVHLGYHGQQLTAVIEFEGERYRIVGGFEGPHRLARLSDEFGVKSCGFDGVTGSGASRTLRNQELKAALDEPFTKTTTRVDVLAVYPKAYFAYGPASEAGVFNFIQDSISLANDIFVNSQVNAYYNLVGIVPITGAQPSSTGAYDALIWLNSQPTEVVNLRNAFGADIVTIFIPFIWSTNAVCGVANLPQNNNTFQSAIGSTQLGVVNAPMGDRAFTANRDGCGLGDFTLAHEIGHNYGMYHEAIGSPSLAIFPHGRAHTLTSLSKATAMGCYCLSGCTAGSSAVCNRIAHFSDPNISYQGVPTGTFAAGSDPGRNNASVARTQTVSYAGFRAQSTNTPPTANFTVSCTGRTCTFDASSSTDNTTIPTTGYWWDFGDGTTGTGKIVNKTYGGSGTFFWVHLVVKDSGGQTDVTLNSATPQ